MSVRYRGRSPQKNNTSLSNIVTRYDDERKYKRKYNPHVNSKCVFLLKFINMRTTPSVALVFNRRHTATATILVFVYDRKKKSTNKRPASVELRLTLERKTKYMSTGIRLLPKEWQRGTVVNRMDAAELNELLNSIMVRARKVVNSMVETGTTIF